MEDRYLNHEEAAKYLGVSKMTLYLWIYQKKGPLVYKLNNTLLRYKKSDLDNFIEQYKVNYD